MEGITRAELVLGCSTLDETLQFFTQRLGFVVEAIHPADSPTVAVVAAYGLRLRLDCAVQPFPVTVNLYCDDETLQRLEGGRLEAPNGAAVNLRPCKPPLTIPPLVEAQHVVHVGTETWVAGRAGMQYRDLVPSRLGGRFIASHIRIPDGGSVPDYVHFHRIRFQVIFCVKGWVKVVYEDQGEPFLLQEGDCVLQPPEIRHRVLECSPGLEVVEIGCPAEHETIADHSTELPTSTVRPERSFGGQLFCRHVADGKDWGPSSRPGYQVLPSGIIEATSGLASVTVWRNSVPSNGNAQELTHNSEFRLSFVLRGDCKLTFGSREEELARGSAVCLPAGLQHSISSPSDDFTWVEFELPGRQVN